YMGSAKLWCQGRRLSQIIRSFRILTTLDQKHSDIIICVGIVGIGRHRALEVMQRLLAVAIQVKSETEVVVRHRVVPSHGDGMCEQSARVLPYGRLLMAHDCERHQERASGQGKASANTGQMQSDRKSVV